MRERVAPRPRDHRDAGAGAPLRRHARDRGERGWWLLRAGPAARRACMIRVLVADDQALVRAGFRAILEEQDDLEVVGEAEDGGQAVAISAELQPDVVLMDVRMPGVDGIEATQRL